MLDFFFFFVLLLHIFIFFSVQAVRSKVILMIVFISLITTKIPVSTNLFKWVFELVTL